MLLWFWTKTSITQHNNNNNNNNNTNNESNVERGRIRILTGGKK
jgi:hypothetical protein